MYAQKQERCILLRTVAAIVSAVCLVLMTVSMGVAGIYTFRAVDTINVEEVHYMVANLSSTMGHLNRASTMLRTSSPSSHGSLIEEIPRIIYQIQPLLQDAPNMSVRLLEASRNIRLASQAALPLVRELEPILPQALRLASQITTILQNVSGTLHNTTKTSQEALELMKTQSFVQLIGKMIVQTGNMADAVNHVPFARALSLAERHEDIVTDLSWVERFSAGLINLSKALNKLDAGKLLREAQNWRNMSEHASELIHKMSAFL